MYYTIFLNNLFLFLFFQFSVRVSDQYNPPKSAICSVQIDVLRDTTLPVFLQPFTFQTEEVKPPGSYVGNVRAIDPDNNVISLQFFYNYLNFLFKEIL